METNSPDPVRDVTLLMMVREMPQEDFHQLCENVLRGNVTTQLMTYGSGEHLDALGQYGTHGTVCELCAEPVETDPLNAAMRDATGMAACKACIDEALGQLFGPDAEARSIAAHVLKLAARRPSSRRHVRA
jgi:hypothetical protein